ncbi:MAG: alpha-L-fucosidase [Bacteroidales bacterium]|nr:alpha-L-fucosidase [Bacteroidales bacterium]
MKRIYTFIVACLAVAGAFAQQVSPQAFQRWHESKFSMFIHFGLYSELGGVWQGEPVKWGYSEQIQSFAGIFSDWYGETALRFNPTAFNADEIVALAKKAGMRSIVITTKHHDGFCMFRTATTDYNSYDATPCHRDFVKELSDACARGGVRLGLYFSIIDWHFPHAYPISSHNCDFVTPQHHSFSKQQVTELLTHYGPISELWFDMGSNTPEQSRELYELVHRLQPDCMVSGRVGNDQYDFAVMADNSYPEGALQCPWQSAASMFDETWSYRSWQERGSAHVKAMEKLRSLINVVSHGGNFLLNIGPKGDGSVVDFESEVLQEMGGWLQQHGEAIYGTEASPFRTKFDWGMITRKDTRLYLILSGTRPADGRITLEVPGHRLLKAEGKVDSYEQKGAEVRLTVPADAYDDQTIQVLTLNFDTPVEPRPMNVQQGGAWLTAQNATPNYSYSCFDYYSNYRSTVSYSWNVRKSGLKRLTLQYTPQEVGKEVEVTVDGKTCTVKLEGGKSCTLPVAGLAWGERYLCGPGSSVFDGPSVLHTDLQKAPVRRGSWQAVAKEQDEFQANILQTYFVLQEVESPKAQDVLLEVGAGNGIEVYLNGESVMKHLNPYRCTFRAEQLLLPLQKGKNQIVLRAYNRFEKKTGYLLRLAAEQVVYQQVVELPEAATGASHTLTVRQKGLPSQHTDTELANLRILLK